MKRAAIITAVCLTLWTAVAGQTRNTRRSHLQVDEHLIESKAADCDTLAVGPSAIVVSGYDKPTRTNRETALFTNNTGRMVETIVLKLRYTDRRGRTLHTQRRLINTELPAGETRMLYWPTWDRQQSFHYIRSRKARGSVSTPYEVVCTVDTVMVAKQSGSL